MNAAPDYSGSVNAIGSFASPVGFVLAPAAVGAPAVRYGIDRAMDAVIGLPVLYLIAVLVNRLRDRTA